MAATAACSSSPSAASRTPGTMAHPCSTIASAASAPVSTRGTVAIARSVAAHALAQRVQPGLLLRGERVDARGADLVEEDVEFRLLERSGPVVLRRPGSRDHRARARG